MMVVVLLAHAFIVNAQDAEKRNTSESAGKQLLNNRVPGFKYAPEQSKTQRKITLAEQEENHRESSGMQLKKGTVRGMRYATAGAGAATVAPRTTVRRPAAGTLSSDQKAGEVKTEPAAVAPVAPAAPTQGDVSEPVKAEKKAQ